jgi:hypothetical protein
MIVYDIGVFLFLFFWKISGLVSIRLVFTCKVAIVVIFTTGRFTGREFLFLFVLVDTQ